MDFQPPETVYGVDFSAAKSDSGAKTWVTEISAGGGRPRVTACESLADLEGVSASRDASLGALVGFISGRERCAVGLDFPFSLPADWTGGSDSWDEFVGSFGSTFDGPKDLHETMKADLDGTFGRETDDTHGAQCPYGWRIKTQTYYGIGEVLAEVRGDGVAVLPFESHGPGDTLVVETYPAATLEALSANRTGYRGVREENRRNRRENLDELVSRGLHLPDELRERAYFSDDAHDSIVAAYATYRNTREVESLETEAAHEGNIYA